MVSVIRTRALPGVKPSIYRSNWQTKMRSDKPTTISSRNPRTAEAPFANQTTTCQKAPHRVQTPSRFVGRSSQPARRRILSSFVTAWWVKAEWRRRARRIFGWRNPTLGRMEHKEEEKDRKAKRRTGASHDNGCHARHELLLPRHDRGGDTKAGLKRTLANDTEYGSLLVVLS